MAITVTINAVDRTSKSLLNQLAIDYSLGSDWTATFPVRDTLSTSSAYRPSLDHSVTIADGATTLFHGTVTRVEDKPIAPPHVGTLTVVTARAKSQVVDQIIVTETYTAGQTLHDVVADLRTTYLAAYSITLDAGMGTGPTLEEQVFETVTLREALNHLSEITGWVWRITPSDVLEFFSVGTKTASYSLTAANKLSVGPITWDKTRQQYVNSVYLQYGTESQVPKTQTITGNGILTEWALDYDSARNESNYILSAGYVTDDGIFSPLSEYPTGTTNWQFDPTTNHLLRTAGALGNTKVATFVYAAQFPQVIIVEDAGEIASNGRFSARFKAPYIFDKDAATEKATGELRRMLAVPQWVHTRTRQGFVMPGDTITLTFADRTISGSHLISQVNVTTIARGTPMYALTCLSGSEAQSTWVDLLKNAIGGGAANAAGGTISGAAVPNFSGRFDEDVSAWTGFDNTGDGFESKLTTYANSAGEGPALQLGRDDTDYRWVITADSDNGASPGTVAKLRFHIPRRGSSIECATYIVEDLSDNFVMLPGANAHFYLGDYANLISGLTGADERITGVMATDAMVTNGYFERSRTTRLGEWVDVVFNAANFSGNGAMTWTLTSPDQEDFSFSLSGKTMTLSIALRQTTVGGTLNTTLLLPIPGGFAAARTHKVPVELIDNGVISPGVAFVTNGATSVGIVRSDGAPFTASTNATYVNTVFPFSIQ